MRMSQKDRMCKGCGAKPEEVRWYKGVTTHCAECWKAKVRQRAIEQADYINAYDRARGMLPHRVEARAAYRQTEAGKEAVARAYRVSHARFPEHRRARVIVGNAVRDGRLVKPTACERCGTECSAKRSLHAHHHDYSQPLVVEWLCGTCHRLEHRPPPAEVGVRLTAAGVIGADGCTHQPDEIAA